MALPLLPTTVVGSYAQPDWLVNREILMGRGPARIRAHDIWRVPEEFLDDAQDDATVVAIRDMERAGVDIITDGEIRRESYSNRFATALGGIDIENFAIVAGRSDKPSQVPRITGRIRRVAPVEVRDVEFLRANTDRTIKITIPGPFTMTQQAQNDYYPDAESAAMDYAAAVNEEIRALYAAGADIVQLDEPYMQANPDEARKYAVRAINRALDGVTGTTALHICFGYAHTITTEKTGGYNFLAELEDCSVQQVSVEAAQPRLDLSILSVLPSKKLIVGVIDMGDPDIETAEIVADRVRNAVAHAPAERLVIAPDCGMKYLDRATAFGKLKAMVDGTRIVRRELAG
ncbi:MAG: uroporphyrinogen decarboxylase family protein [Alphaproteobacteria bacterium]